MTLTGETEAVGETSVPRTSNLVALFATQTCYLTGRRLTASAMALGKAVDNNGEKLVRRKKMN